MALWLPTVTVRVVEPAACPVTFPSDMVAMEESPLGWREDEEDYNGQGHRRNMLNENFTAIGMGHVYYNGTLAS